MILFFIHLTICYIKWKKPRYIEMNLKPKGIHLNIKLKETSKYEHCCASSCVGMFLLKTCWFIFRRLTNCFRAQENCILSPNWLFKEIKRYQKCFSHNLIKVTLWHPSSVIESVSLKSQCNELYHLIFLIFYPKCFFF